MDFYTAMSKIYTDLGVNVTQAELIRLTQYSIEILQFFTRKKSLLEKGMNINKIFYLISYISYIVNFVYFLSKKSLFKKRDDKHTYVNLTIDF